MSTLILLVLTILLVLNTNSLNRFSGWKSEEREPGQSALVERHQRGQSESARNQTTNSGQAEQQVEQVQFLSIRALLLHI